MSFEWIGLGGKKKYAFQLNPAPVTVISKLSHSAADTDNTVKKQIYCTQNIFLMIIRACMQFPHLCSDK